MCDIFDGTLALVVDVLAAERMGAIPRFNLNGRKIRAIGHEFRYKTIDICTHIAQ